MLCHAPGPMGTSREPPGPPTPARPTDTYPCVFQFLLDSAPVPGVPMPPWTVAEGKLPRS